MKIPFTRVERAIHSDEYIGFCIACGEEAYGVEPDAHEYECESCGARKVYGAEEILIMGLADMSDEANSDEDDDSEFDE